MTIRIGIVAAEPSGDQLAAQLMQAILIVNPDVIFEGIGGDKMMKQGFSSWYPMEKLSVMGIVEVLKHLPELLSIRKHLYLRWKQSPPDVFIGVDAPDFNLGLEKKLRRLSVPTVHYVCPSIWAWRKGRVKTLRQSVDLILSIFPFEVPLLEKYQLDAVYAGHPLAMEINGQPLQSEARQQLGIPETATVLALLPGSRMSEVTALTDLFLQTAEVIKKQITDLVVVMPLVTENIYRHVDNVKNRDFPDLPVLLVKGNSRAVISSSDVVLTASGTATLEIMLYQKPMVVGYKIHWLTYFIGFTLGLVKVKHIAMPNILADKRLVPEMFQADCTVENMSRELLVFLTDKDKNNKIREEFRRLTDELSEGDKLRTATAVLDLVKTR